MDRAVRALAPSSSGFKTHGTHKNKPTQYVKKKGDVDFLVAYLYVYDIKKLVLYPLVSLKQWLS